jgi:hypothetical protein
MTMKFRKRPVEIEAVQWNVDGLAIVPPWLREGLRKPWGDDGSVIRHGDDIVIHTLEGQMTAKPGDWIIRGIAGEIYPCKPDIFEACYLPGVSADKAANGGDPPLDFSQALLLLKAGTPVRRLGWNHPDQFVYRVPPASYPAQTPTAKARFGETVPYGAYYAIKTVQGNVVPWLASQTDLEANDWVAVAIPDAVVEDNRGATAS